MNTESHPSFWRCSISIWTPTMLAQGTWPLGAFLYRSGHIELRTLGAKIAFTPDQVVEMRFYWRPFPVIKALITHAGGHALATICVFRGERLQKVISECGFKITTRSLWNLGGEDAKIVKAYGLHTPAA